MTSLLPRLAALVASVFSFRVVMAFCTSVAVTTAVSGPLAYKASQIRAELAAAREIPEISQPAPGDPQVTAPPVTDPETGEVIETTTTTSTTTTSTTTSTPAPGATTTPGATPTTPRPTTPGTTPRPTTPGTTAPPTTRPPLTPDGLTVALDAALTQNFPLDGFRLFGRLYIYADISGATSVSYWIDATGPDGPADRVDSSAPFTLGAPSFNTAGLGNGTHSLYMRATTPLGVMERYAVFEVVNP